MSRSADNGAGDQPPMSEATLLPRPAILLDRDGVLNVKAPEGGYITSWSQFQWLPGAREAVRMLKDAGYIVVVITNQAGIARGMMTEADLRDIHERMQASLAEGGAAVDAIYYCPHPDSSLLRVVHEKILTTPTLAGEVDERSHGKPLSL